MIILLLIVDRIYYIIKFLFKKLKIEENIDLLLKYNRFIPFINNFLYDIFLSSNLKLFNFLKASDIYIYEYPSSRLILSLLKENGIAIDVGASVGQITILLAKKLTKGLVYAFEPNPRNFEILRKRIKIFDLRNVILENKAIGDVSGKVKLYLNKTQDNASSIYVKGSSKGWIEVECIRLADYINQKIDLIKIDVEGGELKVLKGMQSLIDKTKAVIFEFNPYLIKAAGFSPEELLKFFINKGFYLYEINLNKVSLIYDVHKFSNKIKHYTDILAYKP